MNDRENDTKKETDGRQVQQELESQLRAFGDTMSDAFAHGFEGRGEDIGDRAYGVGRAAVDAANYGINEAAKAFRSRRNAHNGAPEQKEQGLNEEHRAPQAAGMPGWFRQMFGKAEMTPADEIRASAKKRYSAGCALLAVGITFTVIFGITAVSCLGAAGLFTPNAAVLQAILQDSFMAENAAAMGSFALGAVRITGWCFAAVTAVFVWMITAGASRLKASKTLLRLAEAAEGFDCKKGLPLEAVDEKKTRALKWVRRFIRNGWLSAWVDEKAEKLYLTAEDYYREELYYDIEFQQYMQFKFHEQWMKLKAYANENGIKIIGDIPIYVAMDSADTWAHPELFQLDEENIPTAVAGCPPDGFSATGQLWGNPLYRWDYHRDTGYSWWISRLHYVFQMYDVVRIDHFRGFDEYFSIPYGAENAIGGHWEKGPGIDLFRKVEQALGWKQVIAEDLGYVTDSVRELVRESGFPGMKVLEFAFDSRDSSGAGDYLPHNYEHNCVAYTGTHDNETILGWLSSIKPEEVQMVRAYLNRPTESKQVLASELIRTTIASVADTCIIPIQDYLGLDNSARINFPSTLGTNWRWRLIKSDLTKALADSIRKQNIVYGRVKWEDLQEDEKPKDPEEEKETETEPKQKEDSSVKEAKD